MINPSDSVVQRALAQLRSFPRWLKIALVSAGPLLLFLIIAERASWRPRTLRYDTPVLTVAYSPDGKWLACARQAQLEVRDAHSEQVAWSLPFARGLCKAVAFAPDSRTLLVIRRYQLQLWDVASHRLQRVLSAGRRFPGTVILCAPDGSHIVTGGGEVAPLWWDLRAVPTAKTAQPLVAWWAGSPVALAPNGQTLALLYYSHSPVHIHLWAISSWHHLHSLPAPHGDNMSCAAFAPDGKTIATGTESGRVILWEVATGRQLNIFNGHLGDVESLAFTHDGRWLASGGAEGTTNLWDLATGQILRTLNSRSGPVISIAITPDDTRLATACEKNTVKIWRIK